MTASQEPPAEALLRFEDADCEPKGHASSSFQYLVDPSGERIATLTLRASSTEECRALNQAIVTILAETPALLQRLLAHPHLNGTFYPGIMVDSPQRRDNLDGHRSTSKWFAELRNGLNIHNPEALLARSELLHPPSDPALCIAELLERLNEQVIEALRTLQTSPKTSIHPQRRSEPALSVP